MARVGVAPRAHADLIEILGTSFDRWGEEGKARYEALLEAAIQELGANPKHLMSKDCHDLAPGLRSFHVRYVGRDHDVKTPVHIIYYYRKTRSSIVDRRSSIVDRRSSIVIVRVLHERMEPSVHLAATPRVRHPHHK